MFMRQGHSGPDRDRELEHRHGTVRVGGLEQKLYPDIANLNELAFHNRLTSLEWWSNEFDSRFSGGGL